MKIFTKKNVLCAVLSVVIFASVLAPISAAAAVLVEQILGNQSVSNCGGCKIGQTFLLENGGTIDTVVAKFFNREVESDYTLEFWNVDTGTGLPYGDPIATYVYPDFIGSDGIDYMSVSPALDLESGSYAFTFYDYGISLKTIGSDAYTDGVLVNFQDGNWFPILQPRDMWFQILGTPPPADTIKILSPTSTPAYDFSNWEIEFGTATSTTATSTDFYIKQIYTGTATSTMITLSGNSLLFESPLNIGNLTIFNPATLYYAQAELRYFIDVYDSAGSLVATSDIVSFTTSNLSETELSLFDLPTSTSTIAEWTFTCDPDSPFFTKSFCNLARFLFVPTPSSIATVYNLKSQIETKPPMAYFTLISAALGDINSSGTPAFALVGVQGLEGFLSPFRNVLTIAFYLLFAFWLLHRIRNFDFHL